MIPEDKKGPYARAGIPKDFWEADISQVPESDPNPEIDLSYRKAVAGYKGDLPRMVSEGLGLCLYGPAKSGKTFLGCILLKEAFDKGKLIYRVTLENLTENGKNTFNDACTISERAREVNVLLLDDVFLHEKELPAPQAIVLRTILKYRNLERRTTILVIQGDLEEVVEKDTQTGEVIREVDPETGKEIKRYRFKNVSDADQKDIVEAMKMVKVAAYDYGEAKVKEKERKMDAYIEEGLKNLENNNKPAS